MKIGIALPLPPEPPAVTIDPAVYAREAERLGFESLWAPEHNVAPVQAASFSPDFKGGQVPGFLDPMVALAMASAVTTRIMLGTHVMIVCERNPLMLAKGVATLDLYSGGRFILAIGSGWLREEIELMGGDFDRRWGQSREIVQAMKALWTGEAVEVHDKHCDFPPVRCLPRPAQRPHPPVLLGGRAAKVHERVVAWGDGWAPGSRVTLEEIRTGRVKLDRLAQEAGRDPRSITISAFRPTADRELVTRCEDAGVDRVILRHGLTPGPSPPEGWRGGPDGADERRALEELRKVAERVL